ncbi:MAG: hypothetical protein M9885_09690 [Burkholderiaceae bacterium]|nr:hypothetical protein [Burkholderiaceae bacterium]
MRFLPDGAFARIPLRLAFAATCVLLLGACGIGAEDFTSTGIGFGQGIDIAPMEKPVTADGTNGVHR